MTYDQSQLDLIRKLSGIGVNAKDICRIIDVPLDDFLTDIESNTDVQKALDTGRAQATATIAGVAFDHAQTSKDWKASFTWMKMHAGWKEQEDVESGYKPLVIEFSDGKRMELTRGVAGKKDE